ncbi:hypothetical protein L195_g061840, partial [Trifolium pratense]
IFPCLITEIILSQHLEILQLGEVQAKKLAPLTIDYRLFVGTSNSLSCSTKNQVLDELIEVSKALGETFKTRTIGKRNVDNLIKSMTKEPMEEDEQETMNDEVESNS